MDRDFRGASITKSFYLLNLFILFVLSSVMNLILAIIYMFFISKITNILEYRIGYIVLLIGLSSLMLLLGDLFLYAFALRVFVFRRRFDRGMIISFLRGFLAASLPLIIFLTPYIIIGLGGVVNEKLFYHPSGVMIFIYSAFLGLYALFIHPIYSPLASLSINTSLVALETTFISTYKHMRRNLGLFLHIIATSIITFILTTILAAGLIIIFPILREAILPIQNTSQIPPFTWGGGWLEVLRSVMPRYIQLIAGPLYYLIYSYIFRKISMRVLIRRNLL